MRKQHYSYYCNHCREYMNTEVCPIHLTRGILVVDAEDSTYIPPEANPFRSGQEIQQPLPSPGKETATGYAGEALFSFTENEEIEENPGSKSEQNFYTEAFFPHWRHPEANTPAPQQQSPEPPGILKQFDDTQRFRPFMEKPAAPSLGMLFLMAFIIALVAGSASGYFLYRYTRDDSTTLFTTAESLYKDGKYPESLKYYQRFRNHYAEDPALQTRSARISLLEDDFRMPDGRITQLMEKARAAFRAGNYFLPQQDNAAQYIAEMLSIYPEYTEAVNLRDLIVMDTREIAERQVAANNLADAIKCYRQILALDPQNIAAQRRLAELERNLQNRQMAGKNPRASNLPNSQIQKTANDSSAQPADTQITLATAEQPPVAESAIDGGRKQYLYRPRPVLPDELRRSSELMVLAECIVDENGFIEDAQILSSLPGQEYINAALQTLMQYRYQPATFNRIPTRFKSLEILSLR